MKNLELKQNELKKGNYIITDPCYVLSEDNYQKLLYSSDKLDEKGNKEWNPIEGVGSIEGIRLFNHSTRWGDGMYYDDEDYQYGVDSGQIGCIPMELVDDDKLKQVDGERKREDGSSFHLIRKVYFPENFECSYENGVFFIGDFIIKT